MRRWQAEVKILDGIKAPYDDGSALALTVDLPTAFSNALAAVQGTHTKLAAHLAGISATPPTVTSRLHIDVDY